MSSGEFPLPAVAEALQPYIRPREEVTAIRHDLQGYLRGRLREDGQPLTSTSLHDQEISGSDEAPKALSGVRKAYWKALQAHATAQANYEALKAELQQARTTPTETAKSGSGLVNSHYIPLLRERERQRKLQILDGAVADINTAGKGTSSRKLDDVIDESGELAEPPAADTSNLRRDPDVDAKIMQLKKAVLSTKHSIDKHEAASSEASKAEPVVNSSVSESRALQAALDELTAWMETQLSLIGDSESKKGVENGESTQNKADDADTMSLEDIEILYNQYATTRQRLIGTVNNPVKLKGDMPALDDSQKESKGDIATTANASDILLPHISNLVLAKQQEQALMQQSTYLRRQIAGAEDETGRTIARLADESHIVHPGASRGMDWASAGTDAQQETSKYVKQRVETGNAAMASAKQALTDIENIPIAFDSLQ